MGYYCTVPQCTSLAGKTKNVKFHRFPRDVVLADKWNTILKRGKPYTKYSKVCSLHFTQSDYNVTTMGQWKTLSKDAIPSQNLPKLNPDGTVMVIRKSRTVKYKEVKKEDISGEKAEKCLMSSTIYANHSISDSSAVCSEQHDPNLAYRLQTLNSIANNISPTQMLEVPKTEKQDAIMQTDPIQSEEDDTQPNNTYADVHELDYYQKDYEKKPYQQKDDYIPQTNEEYNKEAEKYALERKSHAAYDKVDSMGFQKVVDYPKANEVYYDKYSRQDGYIYQNGYTDSAEMLRNQQHNLQMLQEPHRINENQNFFNENHIKQEVDVKVDEEKFVYEGNKEAIDNSIYTDSQRRLMQQQRLLEQIQQQVKQEPDANGGCDNVMQPQGSPYYQTEPTSNVTGGYYEQISRPGPELLIAKQNALAAHTQLWQNTMKRPFFYSETPPYNGSQLYHRYEMAEANKMNGSAELVLYRPLTEYRRHDDLTRRLLRERLSSHLNLKDNSAPAPEPRPLSSDEHHRAGELGLIPEDLGYNKDSSVM